MKTNLDLFRDTLDVAVPLWVLAYENSSMDQIWARLSEVKQIMDETDLAAMVAGGGKKGEAARGFNATAKAIALLSFFPGGITMVGRKWESHLTHNSVLCDNEVSLSTEENP